MTYVVDASAAVEFLLRTDIGFYIDGLISDASLLAPELLDVEVLSVLRREVRHKRVSPARAEEAVSDLRDWDIVRLSHRPLLASAWAFRQNASAYDAMYAAAARLNAAVI